MERFEDENPKNIYVIRRNLSNLKRWEGEQGWQLPHIGNFRLKVQLTPEEYWVYKDKKDDSLIAHERVDVYLYEVSKSSNTEQFIDLRTDPRFKNYEPIFYNILETPSGTQINQGDGRNMPQVQLYELIRLLIRLSNLTAFM